MSQPVSFCSASSLVGAALISTSLRCRVVEYIGSYHDPDACPPSCAQRHAFYYVRLPPSSSTAARARWGRRRLDLATDLQAALRVLGLDVLPELERSMLADAWALLEPREDAE